MCFFLIVVWSQPQQQRYCNNVEQLDSTDSRKAEYVLSVTHYFRRSIQTF